MTINILGKSMQPYTKACAFFIINSKNYISYSKMWMKSAAIVVFSSKLSLGSSFKKDSEFSSKFSIAMWCCGCVASQTFLCHSLKLWYGICWNYDIKLPLFSNIKLNFSFSTSEKRIESVLFWEICKSRLYSPNVSTDILDFLLVYVY